MVLCIETLGLLVPLEHREIYYPQRSKLLRVTQAQLLGNLQTKCAQLSQCLILLTAQNQAQVARFCTQTLGDSLQFVWREELVNRRFDTTLLNTNPNQALCSYLRTLNIVCQCVNLLAGVRSTTCCSETYNILCIVKHREVVAVSQVGNIRELHSETQIRLIRAVLLHCLAPRHTAEWLRKVDIQDVLEHVFCPTLEDFEYILLLDKCHLTVNLCKFRLTVGTQILIAEATYNLEVAVVTCNHQQLLQSLWRLWQCIELVRVHTRRHNEVTRSLRS